WNAKDIANMADLTCIVQAGGEPQEFKIPYPQDLCAFPEDVQTEVNACLAAVYQQPIYKEPLEHPVVEPEPQPKPAQPKKAPRRAPQGRPKNSGRTSERR